MDIKILSCDIAVFKYFEFDISTLGKYLGIYIVFGII